MHYTLIDMDTYPRKEHFQFYMNVLPCGYSATVQLDVTNIYHFCKDNKQSFYATMMYVVTKTMNENENMRYMLDEDGNLGIWDSIYPNFTIFHEDDHTFSDVWMDAYDTYIDFMNEYTRVMEVYGNKHGMKVRSPQPKNYYCISCVPWMDFSGYSTTSKNGYAFFPITTFGKYTCKEGIYTLPFALTINHACSDGYHTSQFFIQLQDNINTFKG